MTFIIKHIPEDFIVKENSTFALQLSGSYTYFLLKKRNLTTLDALTKIASVLHKPLKDFNWAGNKDKIAVTEQTCSVKKVSLPQLSKLDFENMSIMPLGYHNDPVFTGMHYSNTFTITVRNISTLPVFNNSFINYFGVQRFSSNNHIIGKFLIQKNYSEALKLIMQQQTPAAESIQSYLTQKPNDFLGALSHVQPRLLLLYIHAYQSFLWNSIVSSNQKLTMLSLPGFNASHPLITTLLQKEELTIKDFINKQIPLLTVEGYEREVHSFVQDLAIGTLQSDEYHAGMQKITISFTLQKGSYATEYIRQTFKNTILPPLIT